MRQAPCWDKMSVVISNITCRAHLCQIHIFKLVQALGSETAICRASNLPSLVMENIILTTVPTVILESPMSLLSFEMWVSFVTNNCNL